MKNKAISEGNSPDSKKRKVTESKCTADECKICKLETFVNKDWYECFKSEYSKTYFANIKQFLHSIPVFYPKIEDVFNFTNFTMFEDIKVVIIGQDPYHNPGQAMGLSFSVPKTTKSPPSLKNIYKEIKADTGNFVDPNHGDLSSWAKQGVLLLNDTLTVTKNQPASHSKIGWKNFTKTVLQKIDSDLNNVVFVLWGNHAKEKGVLVNKKKHLVLEAGHPSPFSVKLFLGCKHFSKINNYLVSNDKTAINWQN